MPDQVDLAGAIARTVQALRAERGWSLDQLAKRCRVSKGVLVAVEQGRSNPSLGTLARISDAFGVPVTRLVEVSEQPDVSISVPRPLWHGPSGGTGTIIGATDPPWAAELWQWRVEPGETFGGQAHAPATRELIWVESGTITLEVAGREQEIEAGQCARFSGGLPHEYANRGTEATTMIMVVTVPPSV
ncbi:MAG TPA: XRE family transcriptional regulator [Streptosporangiaceae bacterium]|nr:XRE family transcriptional regulator [Streptosporangiaceae bacterium]